MIQLFVSDKGFVKVCGIKSETEILNAVKLFCKEVGVHKTVIVDLSPYQTSDKVCQLCHKVGTTLCVCWKNQHNTLIELSCTLD